MKENVLEKKIKKATIKKDYNEVMEILIKEYTKQFNKMLKFKKIKPLKSWYMNDYLNNIKRVYSPYFDAEIDELNEVLYSNKYLVKDQIEWLLSNCYLFNDYKY